MGRRTGVTDPRTGTSGTGYNSKGQVAWQADAAGNTNWFAYDADTGRRVAVTNALGEASDYEYDAEGHLLATWGNVYPVAYAYDDFDRMSAMYTTTNSALTFTDYASITNNLTSSFNETRWLYDEASGLLTNKLYADGKGTAYEYTADGNLSERTWARSNYTVYAYDDCCGALTNISYFAPGGSPDNVTSNITFGYNRIGQRANITDAAGEWALAYDAATLALSNEVLVAHAGVTNVLSRTQDEEGRNSGFSLDGDYSVDYGYDMTGRLNQVAWTFGALSYTATYSFVENSDMIGGYDIPVGANTLKVRKAYESNRNLIATVSNLWNSTAVSGYVYGNDAIGRRTNRIDTGSVTNVFGYNVRSELTDADMGTNTYGYAYDPIGNRLSFTSSVQSVASEVTYLSNELNQYTQITNGGLRTLSYDSDGNLTNDGVRLYEWNGENRLIAAYPETPSSGDKKAEFKYDYMGRRFMKTVSSWDGSEWVPVQTNLFTYDGWNLICETIHNQASTSTNHYVWGSDLSGSLQGAGGIGGLLCVIEAGTPYFPVHDANGNITEYLNTSGTVVAHYEYDPFGNTLYSSGSKKDDFPFRFSQKYLDQETGMGYWGYRYYHPDLGRWPSRDPLAQWSHHRCYLFVENSPINKRDLFGLISVAGCQRSVDRFMDDPDRYSSVLADVLDAIDAIEGCTALRPECECCTGDAANWRAYVSGDGTRLVICANNANANSSTGENVTQILLQSLVHENIHVLQRCRNQDLNSCAGAVCTEIQAALNSGRCQITSPGNVRQCVIDLAVLSSQNRCPREGQAEEYADQLYGQCNRPIDEIPSPVLLPPSW